MKKPLPPALISVHRRFSLPPPSIAATPRPRRVLFLHRRRRQVHTQFRVRGPQRDRRAGMNRDLCQ